MDYNLTNKDRIYFRYNTDHGVQATGTDAINPAFNANSVQPSYGGQFGYTKAIGSSMVNQLLLSASYYTAIFGPPDLSAALADLPDHLCRLRRTAFHQSRRWWNPGQLATTFIRRGAKCANGSCVDDYSMDSRQAHDQIRY